MTRQGDAFDRLTAVMARLRGPDGCPWDLDQDHESIKGHLVEEAYEVLDALEAADDPAFSEELGDLLLQIVFHARMAEERGAFDMTDVIEKILAKLERRHPHIFGDLELGTADEVLSNWEKIKRAEKEGKSALAGVPASLPALMYAQRVQHKAAHVGFDWETSAPVYEKLDEEIAELREAGEDPARLEEELGDVLFTVVNLGRKSGIDAETALRSVVTKFMRRFKRMEELALAQGRPLAELSLAEQDALWEQAKSEEGAT
jgi:tetrapyrrole methylase family protein/MazG family protein